MARFGILIVEDEGIVARDIERLLAAAGYSVSGITSTGEDAVALAGTLRPALVLMDIHLGGTIDGITAATRIREQFAIPCVFLTAYATDDVVERAKQAEPLGYLLKPFDEHSLRTTVEIALQKDDSDRRLRQGESRYRAMVNSCPDAIITANQQGVIVGWSPSATEIFGYSLAEGLGLSLAALLAEPFRAAQLSVWREGPSTGTPAGEVVELEGVRKDGQVFPIEMSRAWWEDDGGWLGTAFIHDSSRRKRDEASLRLQSAALAAAANAMVITDALGTIEWVNPAFATLTGYTTAEAIGKNPRDLVKSGAQAREFYEQLWQTITSGQVWDGELINRRKDGTTYDEHQTITPVRRADGSITHFIAIKRDITEDKRLRAEFLQAQKMEIVGRLAGGIAHDFNNVLTVINGTADLAAMDLAAMAIPEVASLRRDLEQVRTAGERATWITRQLLAFSRKQVVAPTQVAVADHVAGAAGTIRRLVGEDITVAVEVLPATGSVYIDPGQLEQVLMNLAVNARDAMPAGGRLSIQARRVENDAVTHADCPAGDYVMLSVTDTGVGMTAEVRARLFEPFFTTKERGKGTGLGLATVQGIVSQAAGYLEVDSAPGLGSTFRIYLPRYAGADAAAALEVESGSGTETILVVEDDAILRDLTARALRLRGFTVLTASNGFQAQSILLEYVGAVHLVLSDVVMPGMSGIDLAGVIGTSHPQIKVLLMSGYTDDARLAHPLVTDSTRFIRKPYLMAEITRKVRSVLDEPVAGL